MSKNLSKKPILAIISDTLIYKRNDILAFEPVLREVSNFSYLFSKIHWLGFNHNADPPKNFKFVRDDKINISTVIPSGGNSFFKKMAVIILLPYYFYKIFGIIKISDIVHTRGPSIPAMLAIFISLFFPYKKYWHKYGGGWQLQSKAASYEIQKWMLLKKLPGKVVVSQRNSLDPKNIFNWPNPCLTNKEIYYNQKIGLKKSYVNKFVLCFIGRLESEKGFPSLLDAIGKLKESHYINRIHFVGEVVDNEKIKSKEFSDGIEVIFHGILDRETINDIYADSHFIILPSQSEGFPKVLAEASSFGCIPIVPSIPSIILHINEREKNGIVLHNISKEQIFKTIINLKNMRNELPFISKNAINNAKKFSYENYNYRILNEIIQS